MILVVDPHSGIPVYRQLMEQVQFQVASGLLKPGDEIPSTRALSAQLGVNFMTVSKAFRLLEEEGILQRRPGLASVVRAQRGGRLRANKVQRLRSSLRPVATKARQLGLGTDEALEVFRELLEGQEGSAMTPVFETKGLTRRYGELSALDDVCLSIGRGSIVGLVGKNGSGKTTLFRHVVGLCLPSSGTVTTLGQPSGSLGPKQLSRIGLVAQEHCFLDWMSVDEHIRYVASFYERWDRDRETRLRRDLELDASTRVGALSAGGVQKLAIVLAVCHHPELLLLDEPVSDLDPIARARLLGFLLEVLGEGECTVVVSSHVLRDVEKVVDWLVCLDRGRVIKDVALDELKECFAEWLVTTRSGDLPQSFGEAFVLAQELSGAQARLLVQARSADLDSFRDRHGVEVASRPLNLEELFPILVDEALS